MKIRSLEDEGDPMFRTEGGGGGTNEKNDSGAESSESTVATLEPGCAPTSPSRYVIGRKRTLVEIFSVLLLEKGNTRGVDEILQESLVLSGLNHNGVYQSHVLCDISADKPMQIDSQCYLILNGPHYGLEFQEFIDISPSYYPKYDYTSPFSIWDNIGDEYDIFMCDSVETLNGFMVVNFAVYRDGLEAQLEVTMSDLELHGMPLDLYGTVTTSNSAVPDPEAKSYLFNHIRSDTCTIPDLASSAKAEIPLPLSRGVTVIPRESTLIVDLHLFLRCASGDISIANESVYFHAATRSNTVEERIIKGSYAELKVKVTWKEALEYDGEGHEGKRETVDDGEVTEDQEEVSEDDEVTDDEAAISEECDKEGYQGTVSENISDDDCSLRSLKIRRLDIQGDVSTGAVVCHTTEAMEIAGGGQGAALEVQRFKRHYLEVFSVKFLDIGNLKLDEIYGLIGIRAGLPQLIFRRVRGDPSKIGSQGFAILEGPRRCALDVCQWISIMPFLFKYQDFEDTGRHDCCDLWYAAYDDSMDELLCKILDSDLGRLEVNFAVYLDGVEAHLNVMLTDCSFACAQVHGTITASNSMLQNPLAVSVVFKKEKTEVDHVTVGLGKEISLPLLRPVVALPLNSVFTVRVDIFSEGESIIHHPFEFRVPLVGEFEKTVPGNGCGVKVNVKFNNEQGDFDDCLQ